MAGEFGWGGLGGGPGGIAFPDILTALGTALLSSPRDAPFSNLPQTLQTGMQASQQRQSNAALAMALKQAGIDDATAATLAMNPTAASLAISQANLKQKLALGNSIGDDIGRIYGGSAGNMGLGASPPSGGAPLDLGNGKVPVSGAPSPDQYASAIKGNESSGNYQALGPVTRKGDRAYGAYQVMGANIGPWTKEILGREMTPQEFLADPKAQDAVFQGKFGQYVQKTGNPQDAASMWFTGRPLAQGASARDQLGTTGQSYVDRFNRGIGGGSAPAMAGAPVVDDGSGVSPPAIASATLPTEPYRVAAGGGKIPVPIPPDATKPLSESGFGANTQTIRALAQNKQAMAIKIMSRAAAMGEDGKGYLEIGRAMFEDAKQYLGPTDTEKALEAAGVSKTSPEGRAALQRELDKTIPEVQRNARFAAEGSPTEPASVRRTRQIVGASIPDTRPEAVRLGEAAQDTPGLVSSGIQSEAVRKQADAEAAARAELAKTSTSGAIAVEPLQNALKQASSSYKKIADMGGIGFLEANPVNRWISRNVAVDPPKSIGDALVGTPILGTLANSHRIEVERQKFDNAMAMVKNTVTAIRNKGQGQVSNVERVLLSADLEGMLASPDRDVAEQALGRLQTDIDRAVARDKEIGLYRGEQPIQTPYGVLREKR